jgi:hypothetical protein
MAPPDEVAVPGRLREPRRLLIRSWTRQMREGHASASSASSPGRSRGSVPMTSPSGEGPRATERDEQDLRQSPRTPQACDPGSTTETRGIRIAGCFLRSRREQDPQRTGKPGLGHVSDRCVPTNNSSDAPTARGADGPAVSRLAQQSAEAEPPSPFRSRVGTPSSPSPGHQFQVAPTNPPSASSQSMVTVSGRSRA